MFNVKFITVFDDGTSSQTSIICPNYAVYKRSNGYTITTYPTMTDTNGVDRYVCELYPLTRDSLPKPVGSFGSCYIENAAGKTIDSFHAHEFSKSVGGVSKS